MVEFANAMIEARGLSKFYGPFVAIKDISFTIPKGQIVAHRAAEELHLLRNSADDMPPFRITERLRIVACNSHGARPGRHVDLRHRWHHPDLRRHARW